MKLKNFLLTILMPALATVLVANAQEQKEPAGEAPAAAAAAGPRQPDADPKPYDKVITKDAKTKKGVFTVHWVKNKVYYEIPPSESKTTSLRRIRL